MRATRLPVQHPQAPHCAKCKAPLPNLNSTSLSMAFEEGDFDVLGFTLHIRCKCGATWDLQKGVK